MKKRHSLMIFLASLCLVGCASKSHLHIAFDGFTMQRYDNQKQYADIPLMQNTPGMTVLKEIQEQHIAGESGFINSLIIAKTAIDTGIDISAVMKANIASLKVKLLKYISLNSERKNMKCETKQDSGYINSFSYQWDGQTIYDGQYMFIDSNQLYIISLSSEEQKDIKSFIKSVGTITCAQDIKL